MLAHTWSKATVDGKEVCVMTLRASVAHSQILLLLQILASGMVAQELRHLRIGKQRAGRAKRHPVASEERFRLQSRNKFARLDRLD